ncbi:5-formyltetrahydrofolate cyclo-ligase-like [Schistocerca piceifrons]|uniref:5-formyltetrahydrofolate cyclo-ligase-like n=1 Tax=Schistocerca piceifrons TaxID=274613 RepID=UPI001F5FD5D9|nr:5-formyltetrahydrofolate cyclo-ligase-like [Schistocerca piceifrons]
MTATLKASKNAVRRQMKSVIGALTTEEKLRQSQIVTNMLLQRPEYERSRRVAAYVSKADEVGTEQLIRCIIESGRACFIPRYWERESRMEMLRLRSVEELSALPSTAWGISQPSGEDADSRENALLTGGLDLIVVPGRAFTADGGRLGRGGGYYDVYLGRLRPEAGYSRPQPFTVGLAFRQQVLPHLPLDKADVPLQLVLYPPPEAGNT